MFLNLFKRKKKEDIILTPKEQQIELKSEKGNLFLSRLNDIKSSREQIKSSMINCSNAYLKLKEQESSVNKDLSDSVTDEISVFLTKQLELVNSNLLVMDENMRKNSRLFSFLTELESKMDTDLKLLYRIEIRNEDIQKLLSETHVQGLMSNMVHEDIIDKFNLDDMNNIISSKEEMIEEIYVRIESSINQMEEYMGSIQDDIYLGTPKIFRKDSLLAANNIEKDNQLLLENNIN